MRRERLSCQPLELPVPLELPLVPAVSVPPEVEPLDELDPESATVSDPEEVDPGELLAEPLLPSDAEAEAEP